MVSYAWKPGAWKGGALKVGSWGPETGFSAGGGTSPLDITFTASQTTTYVGQPVYFDFYVSGSAVRLELDADNDGIPDVAPPGPFVNTSGSTGNVYASAGTYSVSFKVHDTTTTVVSTRVNYITILASAADALEIRSFTGSPTVVYTGQAVTFDYYVSGSAVRVELDQENDGTPNTARSTIANASASVQLVYTSLGTYDVSLKIHDTVTTAVFTRTGYITVVASALPPLGGGGTGALKFDMHGGLAGSKKSRSAVTYGLRRGR